jgi:hypothetical protein
MSVEAKNLADLIKKPSLDNLREYRRSIKSMEPAKPFSSTQRLIKAR